MHTILARPTTTAHDEPEPQHDRPADVPEPMPPLPQREPGRTLQAGLFEDMEREDTDLGPEDEPEQRLSETTLWDVVQGLTAQADTQVAKSGGRTVARSRSEMETRLTVRATAQSIDVNLARLTLDQEAELARLFIEAGLTSTTVPGKAHVATAASHTNVDRSAR